MRTGIAILATTLLFGQCTSPTNFNDQGVHSLSNNNWSGDANGCLHLRSKALAEKLIAENELMNAAKGKFLAIFKSPNKTEMKGDTDILEYYFDTVCDSTRSLMQSEKCTAKFYFKSDKLVQTDFICE